MSEVRGYDPNQAEAGNGEATERDEGIESMLGELDKAAVIDLVNNAPEFRDTILESYSEEGLKDWIKWHFTKEAGGQETPEEAAELEGILAEYDQDGLVEFVNEIPVLRDAMLESHSEEGLKDWMKRYLEEGESGGSDVENLDEDEEEIGDEVADEDGVEDEGAVQSKEVDMEEVARIEAKYTLEEEQKAVIRSIEDSLDLPTKWLTANSLDMHLSPLVRSWEESSNLQTGMIEAAVRSIGDAWSDFNDMEPSRSEYAQLDKSAEGYIEGTREKLMSAITELLDGLIPEAEVELRIPERGIAFDPQKHVALAGVKGIDSGLRYMDVASTSIIGIVSKNKALRKPTVLVVNS
ncbi:MAG TPA: hypothetical protein QF873_03780 [Patescibacteria group bacterium]|nr:hypothetical protein [Patescibacteria group bacterium]